jgi:outer membrane immunogenic protein
MRNKLISSLAGAVFSFAASGLAAAADMAVKAPPPAPAPVSSWTGWYVGVNTGWIGSSDPVNTNAVITSVPDFPIITTDMVAAATNQFNNHFNGFLGGGQLGYNYQFSPAWLLALRLIFRAQRLAAVQASPGYKVAN